MRTLKIALLVSVALLIIAGIAVQYAGAQVNACEQVFVSFSSGSPWIGHWPPENTSPCAEWHFEADGILEIQGGWAFGPLLLNGANYPLLDPVPPDTAYHLQASTFLIDDGDIFTWSPTYDVGGTELGVFFRLIPMPATLTNAATVDDYVYVENVGLVVSDWMGENLDDTFRLELTFKREGTFNLNHGWIFKDTNRPVYLNGLELPTEVVVGEAAEQIGGFSAEVTPGEIWVFEFSPTQHNSGQIGLAYTFLPPIRHVYLPVVMQDAVNTNGGEDGAADETVTIRPGDGTQFIKVANAQQPANKEYCVDYIFADNAGNARLADGYFFGTIVSASLNNLPLALLPIDTGEAATHISAMDFQSPEIMQICVQNMNSGQEIGLWIKYPD